MKMSNNFLLRVYGLILRLYPAGFRSVFGDEMYCVFREALQDASRRGFWQLIRFSIHELIDLPYSILSQHKDRIHFQEAEPMEGIRGSWLHRWEIGTKSSGPGTWRDVFFGSLPLIFFLVSGEVLRLLQSRGLLNLDQYFGLSYSASEILAGIYGSITLVVLIIAWRLGWPLWSASWYGYGVWGVLVVTLLMNQMIPQVDLSGILISGVLLSVVIGYLRLIRYDMRRGLLAVLFLTPVYMLSLLEGIPSDVETVVYLSTAFLVILAIGAIVRLRSRLWALSVAVLVNMIASLIMGYVQVFYSEYPGMDWNSALTLIKWGGLTILFSLMTAGILIGPLILWCLWDYGRRDISL